MCKHLYVPNTCCHLVCVTCFIHGCSLICLLWTGHLTRHIFLAFAHLITCTCVAQVVSLACAHHIPWVVFMHSCCLFYSLRLFHFTLFAVHLLSYRPVFPLDHLLPLPRCGGQLPCALSLMSTLALLFECDPQTGYEPNDYHMSETTKSLAWRSFHHCSPRSEKKMRAVDELITLLTKVCRPVSRRLSGVGHDDLLWNDWLPYFKLQGKSVSQLRKWANQDSSGTTKRADSRWLSSRDSKTLISSRL